MADQIPTALGFAFSQTVPETSEPESLPEPLPPALDAFLQPASPVPEPLDQPFPSPDLGRDLCTVLQARGHRILTKDGRLFVSGASRLSETDRAALRQYKPSLLTLAEPWPERETWPPGDPWPPPDPRLHAFTPPRVEMTGGSLADFLNSAPMRTQPNWTAQDPPSLDGIDDIILNFESNGLDWRHGDKAIGVTVGTLDGQLKRFLPFGFEGGGNLSEEAVIRFLREQVRGKRITNAHTSIDVHFGRTIGVDLEEQGNTVSDVMHYAAELDDHRKRFALDVLAQDYLGGIEIPRVDERNMAQYSAAEVAARAEYQVQLVAELRNVMWPQLDAQDLQDVRQLEDDVIYPVCEMERNGSPINVELLHQMSEECMTEHNRLMLELGRETGFAFEHTASGWKKLFEYCGYPPSESGSYAEDVVGVIDHPLIKQAYLAGQYGHLHSKVFAPYKEQVGSDGMLYYDINQLKSDRGGTVSGRFSIGYVQQVPNHENHHQTFGVGDVDACFGLCPLFPRRLFLPKIGDYLDADAAQIEYRLFGHFADSKEVNEAYRLNPRRSFHKMMWEMLKRYKPDMSYVHVKSFDFAKQYGAKSIKLAVMMGFITAAEGEEIRNAKRWNDSRLDQIHEIEAAFKRAMPEGDDLLDRAAYFAKSKCDHYCRKNDKLHQAFDHQGFVRTIIGRRSRYPDNYKTYTGLNRVLQGSASDIMKRKLVELHRERNWTQFLMRLTVHDSVLGDGQQPETAARVSEILDRQSFPQLRIPILWDVKRGPDWARVESK